MNVHHVVSGLTTYGGPSYTVPSLCRALVEHGARVTLHTLDAAPTTGGTPYQIRAHSRCGLIRPLGLSASMRRALMQAADDADILHSHLLWMMPNIYPG